MKKQELITIATSFQQLTPAECRTLKGGDGFWDNLTNIRRTMFGSPLATLKTLAYGPTLIGFSRLAGIYVGSFS